MLIDWPVYVSLFKLAIWLVKCGKPPCNQTRNLKQFRKNAKKVDSSSEKNGDFPFSWTVWVFVVGKHVVNLGSFQVWQRSGGFSYSLDETPGDLPSYKLVDQLYIHNYRTVIGYICHAGPPSYGLIGKSLDHFICLFTVTAKPMKNQHKTL